MGFKVVQSSFAKPWDPKDGEFVIGRYKGTEQIPSPMYDPRVPGSPRYFTSYRIGDLEKEVKAEDGSMVKTFGVSGAMLASKFDQIPRGTLVKLTYAGKQKVGKGMAKMFDVEMDDKVKELDPDHQEAAAPVSDAHESTPFD